MKAFHIPQFILLLLLLAGAMACNQSAYIRDTRPPMLSDTIATEPATDTALSRNDSLPTIGIIDNPVPPKVPDASIAYSFRNQMKKGETRDIHVLLRTNAGEQDTRNALRQKEREQEALAPKEKDTSIIRSLLIKGYDTAYVDIVYDTADFIIKPIATTVKQPIDTIEGNYWHWRIKAIADKASADVLITVMTKTKDGQLAKKDERRIPISIRIDNTTGVRVAWNWVLDNPQYSIPSILVPLITAIYALRRKKKDKA
jgi:hypothetical protein